MADRWQQPLPTTCENTEEGMPSFFVLQGEGRGGEGRGGEGRGGEGRGGEGRGG